MNEAVPPISDELKPCPFCGKQAETMGSGERQRGLMIECITRGCVNPHVSYYDHASAIAAWNRRASEAVKAEVVVTDEMIELAAKAYAAAVADDVEPDERLHEMALRVAIEAALHPQRTP